MRPIPDTIKQLLIINILFFIGSQFLGKMSYDLLALHYFKNDKFIISQLLTHMFMHGSFLHILFNMFGLYMFGSPLVQMWGSKKFLFFYFSAGFGAALIHTLVNYYQIQEGMNSLLNIGMNQSEIMNMLITGQYNSVILEAVSVESIEALYGSFNTPAVGASGAIYGVLVAFAFSFPNSKLMLLFFPFPIKAKFFVPLLIMIDLFFGISSFSVGPIAHFAHVGGAIIGLIMVLYWRKNQFNDRRWD